MGSIALNSRDFEEADEFLLYGSDENSTRARGPAKLTGGKE
jgi:hypothetical protein